MGKSTPNPRKSRLSICIPVGPLNITPGTMHTLAGLAFNRAFHGLLLGSGHVVGARNMAWHGAVKEGADRVLWIDTDVSAPIDKLIGWVQKQDQFFDNNEKYGSVGAVVCKRGGGYAFDLNESRIDPLRLGMGLVYWHVPRVLAALARAGRPMDLPFRMIPPVGEDYEISSLLHMHGAWQAIDSTLPTRHDGVGSWEGAAKPPGTDQIARGGKK